MTKDGMMDELESLLYAQTMLRLCENRKDTDYVILQKQVLRQLIEKATRPHD